MIHEIWLEALSTVLNLMKLFGKKNLNEDGWNDDENEKIKKGMNLIQKKQKNLLFYRVTLLKYLLTIVFSYFSPFLRILPQSVVT
ncbi:MAG: hypothetical protein AAGG81_07980, partial [Chlamydiota bacterium]